jgi:hypothetical protein
MDENPTLLRLKELETLEKVREKVDKLTVFGGLDGVAEGRRAHSGSCELNERRRHHESPIERSGSRDYRDKAITMRNKKPNWHNCFRADE